MKPLFRTLFLVLLCSVHVSFGMNSLLARFRSNQQEENQSQPLSPVSSFSNLQEVEQTTLADSENAIPTAVQLPIQPDLTPFNQNPKKSCYFLTCVSVSCGGMIGILGGLGLTLYLVSQGDAECTRALLDLAAQLMGECPIEIDCPNIPNGAGPYNPSG